MTLNRMYHCVPRIISGDSQISVIGVEAQDQHDRDRERSDWSETPP